MASRVSNPGETRGTRFSMNQGKKPKRRPADPGHPAGDITCVPSGSGALGTGVNLAASGLDFWESFFSRYIGYVQTLVLFTGGVTNCHTDLLGVTNCDFSVAPSVIT